MSNESEAISDLDKKLIRQVEFYFGDYNLHRDKFMIEEMKKNDGWFTMDTMLKFQRLSSMCSEPGTILAALKKSRNGLLEIDVKGEKIRRRPDKAIPDNDTNYRRDLKMRSVYVKGFPQTETIEDITDFFEEDYGKVDGIQLRRFNNKHQGSMFKGSLFVTFGHLENADKFLNAPMVYYKDKPLEKMSKEAFWKEKETETAEKRPFGKKKTSPKKDAGEYEAEEDAANGDEEVYSWIHVTNLTDDTITHMDIKDMFREIEAPEAKFISRYEKNGSSGYVLFGEASAAEETLKLLLEHKNSCVVSIKNANEVTFSAMSEEDGKKARECYEEFRLQKKPRKNQKKHGYGGKKKYVHTRKHKKFEDDVSEPQAKQAKVEDS